MTVHRKSTNSLLDHIRHEIQSSALIGRTLQGHSCACVTFRDYMSMCLYHPDYGYYRSGMSRLGREGDFYTSAHIGDIMGEQLAERLVGLATDQFAGESAVEVVDWGGGTGRLSRQMLDAWTRLGAVGSRFTITVVDGSPGHRRQAEQLLEQHIADGRARVISNEDAQSETWKERSVIVVANELLDAFPVHRVVRRDGRLWECAVGWDDDEAVPVSCVTELSDPRLAEWLNRQSIRLAEGQTTEIGLAAGMWTASLAAELGEAVLVLIDYGDSTAELTAPHRMDGTLLCYEGHLAHNEPLRNPGGQDLTAHVDFDLIRYYAAQAGWREKEYVTQKRFLVESGILSKLAGHDIADPFHPIVRRNRAIRQLLLSDGMSELFKVQTWVK